MTADAVLARELSALQEQLSASRRERPSPAADQEAAAEKKAEPQQPDAAGEERQAAEQLRDLVSLIKEFAEEAEQNVSEHPTASVIGALLLGILIGRMLGKR